MSMSESQMMPESQEPESQTGVRQVRDATNHLRWQYLNDGPLGVKRGDAMWKFASDQKDAMANRARVVASQLKPLSPNTVENAVWKVVSPHFQKVRAAPPRPASSTLPSLRLTRSALALAE